VIWAARSARRAVRLARAKRWKAGLIVLKTIWPPHDGRIAELDWLVEQGMRKKGFAVIETVSYCHTTDGRLTKVGSAVDMMRALKDKGITQTAAAKLTEEERKDRIVRGVLVDIESPEYTAEYDKIIEGAQAAARAQAVATQVTV